MDIKKYNFKKNASPGDKEYVNAVIHKMSLLDHIIIATGNKSLKIYVKNVTDNFLTCVAYNGNKQIGDLKISHCMTTELFNKLVEILHCTSVDMFQLKLSILNYGVSETHIEQLIKIKPASYDQIALFINALYHKCDKSFNFYQEITGNFTRLIEKYNMAKEAAALTTEEEKKQRENLIKQFQQSLISILTPELKINLFLLE